jgi:protein involved in temperature-dependent protein secretion
VVATAILKGQSRFGLVLLQKTDLDAAITACREAIRLEPNDPRPRSQLARLLIQRGDPAAGLAAIEESARLNPAWMTDLKTGLRYHSACCAALAAIGKTKTSNPDTEPSVLRQKALDWLKADLVAWRKHLSDSPEARPIVHEQMLDWLKDTHLSSVRDRKDLDKLPIDEQVGWVKLWTAVRILRDETAPLPLAPPPRLVK